MRKAKSKYFCDKIQASSQMGDSKSGWAWINSLLGRKHKNANINELKVNDDIISDDKSITETLNEYFINIGMKMAAESACQSTDALNDQVIYESTVLLPKENFHFADITIDSVSKRLQKLNVSKATGMDGIPANILKLTSTLIAPSITFIFNLSIRTGIYIDEWKLARVIPIYKSEDKRKCENYRPISILPIISKIFEGKFLLKYIAF